MLLYLSIENIFDRLKKNLSLKIRMMTQKIKIFSLFFLCSFLFGCAHKNPLTEFQFQIVTAPPYVLASWYRIEAPGEPVRIYIEGDGHSFDAYNRPTNNPTPHSTFLRDIAAKDPHSNVVYLARPCQYLQTSTCSQNDWTCARFSSQIINSMEQTVNLFSKKARTQKIVLIGYSGGAQVAGLIAIKQPQKIQKLITIAGVLDQEAWTTYHNDTPLTGSLNLNNYKEILKDIPQIHFVGEKDKVVPLSLTKEFVQDDTKIVVVPKANHQDGFNKILNDIYQSN